MKIVVTGGAGYLGWSLVRTLAAHPHSRKVVVYDNFSQRNYALFTSPKLNESGRIRVMLGDILDSRSLGQIIAGADCVCHLAAVAPSPFSDENPHYFDQVNHWGSAEVAREAEAHRVPAVVYLSSGAVYGHGPRPFRTSDPTNPDASYGISKLAGERQFTRISRTSTVTILRAGTIFGYNPGMRFDTFANRFLLDALVGRALLVHGSGKQLRPIIHVEDLAAIVARIVFGHGPAGIFNAVTENVPVEHAAELIQDLRPQCERLYVNQAQKLRDLALAKDESRIIQEEPSVSFRDGLAESLTALSLD